LSFVSIWVMEYKFSPIDLLDELPHDFVSRYNQLIFQLTGKMAQVTSTELEEVKKRSDSELMLCVFDDLNSLVGLAQGTYVCTPPNYNLYINTVIVDEGQRGTGLGAKLMKELEDVAIQRWSNIKKVSFTSSPKRNTRPFYEKLGYIARVPENGNETIVYVKDFSDHKS
jgi:GNAT superfamily N-acetyltransferase